MARIGVYLRAVLVVLMMVGVAQAEDATAPEQAWQAVITGQIEAFRAYDAPGAFQYAAAPFQTAFPSAEAFLATIIGTGYAPIADSASHTFGSFTKLDEDSVAQEVMLTGKDLSRFEAIYVLIEEEVGWRVSGVQLAKTPGLSI